MYYALLMNPVLQFTEEEFTMRTREMYDKHANMVACDPESASVYGIKSKSALNTSMYFHAVDGLPSDIMHDILEGVLPLHVKVMLKKFISVEKRFTLDELNGRIAKFPFGVTDYRNKPSLQRNLNDMRQSGIALYLFLHWSNILYVVCILYVISIAFN